MTATFETIRECPAGNRAPLIKTIMTVIEMTARHFTRVHTETAFLNKATHGRLDQFLHLARQLYNAALQERIEAYRKAGKSISYYDQCKSLTEIRRDDEAFSRYGVAPFRSVLDRLDKSFKRFFKHGGFPRFKGRNRGIRSFETSQFRIRQAGKRHAVGIKGFGRIKVRRVPDGEIRLIRIVKTPLRVKVQFVTEIEREVVADNSPVVGIDVGIPARQQGNCPAAGRGFSRYAARCRDYRPGCRSCGVERYG